MASANPLNLFAAQSLDRAAPELASLFQEETGTEVIVKLGHSVNLRTEIEGNSPCDIFCSADTGHPKALLTALKATKGFVYARNRLVVVSREERRFMRSTWLSLLTDPSITIGISTPNVSPEGDWAKVLFKNVAKVYRSEPGASIISQHAIPLVGGNHTAEDLRGETAAGFMLRHGVDTAVVYASDTDRMKKEGLVIYEIPDEVMPEILFGACHPRSGKCPTKNCDAFAEFLLSDKAQAVFRKFGFLSPTEKSVKL